MKINLPFRLFTLRPITFLIMSVVFLSSQAFAKTASVKIYKIDQFGVHEKLGVIKLEQTEAGLHLTTKLDGFTQGLHAFHIHENPSCEPGKFNGKLIPGFLAGGHYSRNKPVHSGHEHHHKPDGDLPELIANSFGKINSSLLVEHLNLDEVINRSLIIHSHGEKEDGKSLGGGKRFACGVISK